MIKFEASCATLRAAKSINLGTRREREGDQGIGICGGAAVDGSFYSSDQKKHILVIVKVEERGRGWEILVDYGVQLEGDGQKLASCYVYLAAKLLRFFAWKSQYALEFA